MGVGIPDPGTFGDRDGFAPASRWIRPWPWRRATSPAGGISPRHIRDALSGEVSTRDDPSLYRSTDRLIQTVCYCLVAKVMYINRQPFPENNIHDMMAFSLRVNNCRRYLLSRSRHKKLNHDNDFKETSFNSCFLLNPRPLGPGE